MACSPPGGQRFRDSRGGTTGAGHWGKSGRGGRGATRCHRGGERRARTRLRAATSLSPATRGAPAFWNPTHWVTPADRGGWASNSPPLLPRSDPLGDINPANRLIVTSATYRQSSRVTPELLSKDPQNRLLARGSRLRVDGEIV